MAKKFVRGITNVKTINNQDFDTNNVNDLLSDGEHNYIHRKKKDKSEEYHNLTNNIKTIKSDNTDLLAVTNNNNTTNSATLSPKHDKLKEQVIESTRNTINIEYGENGTEETTKVDTNPQKVLEHENLTDNTPYVTVDHTSGENTTLINSKGVSDKFLVIDQTTNKLNTDFKTLKEETITNITSDTPLIEFTKEGNNVELNGTGLVNIINAKQTKLTPLNTQTLNMSLVSNNLRGNVNISEQENNALSVIDDGLFVEKSTGGLTPQHIEYGTRGQSYYAFREVFGLRTSYTIEVVQGEPELTVVGPLKTVLAQELSTVKTITNGAITLTYDDTDVKIITNTSPANSVEQATFTFYHQS